MSHENSETIQIGQHWYNVRGGTKEALKPIYPFERGFYNSREEAVAAARRRSSLGGGADQPGQFSLDSLPQVGETSAQNPEPDFARVQQAIYIHEGGRRARTPYGYRPREPMLFGVPAWSAPQRYDHVVSEEIRFEWKKFQQASQSGKWPANVPPGSDFITWLARHGYNANPREWHGWEAGVRRLVGGAAPAGGPAHAYPQAFSLDSLPIRSPQGMPGMAPERSQDGLPVGGRPSTPTPPPGAPPGSGYSQKEGTLPTIVRGMIRVSDWITRMAPGLSKQVGKPGSEMAAMMALFSGQKFRYNYETGEYVDADRGQPLPAPQKATVLRDILLGGMTFETGAVSGVARPAGGFRVLSAAEEARAIEQARLSGLPYIGRTRGAQSSHLTPDPATGLTQSTTQFYRDYRRLTGQPQYRQARDPATGKVTKQRVDLVTETQTRVNEMLDRAADASPVVPVGPVQYIRVRDPYTGQFTGEIVRRGERGFSELEKMTLEERLVAVKERMPEYQARMSPVPEAPRVTEGITFKDVVEKPVKKGKAKKPAVTPPTAQETAAAEGELQARIKELQRFVQEQGRVGPGFARGERGFLTLDIFERAKQSMAKAIVQNLDMEDGWFSMMKGVGGQLYQNLIKSSNNVVRNLGPGGQRLVRMVDGVYNDTQVGAAKYIAPLRRLTQNLPAESMDKIRMARNGISVKLSQQEKMVKNVIDQYLDVVVKQKAQAAGIEVPEWVENYWPVRLDWGKLGYSRGSQDLFIQNLMKKRPNMSRAQAEAIWDNFVIDRTAGRPFGNLERPRTHPFVPFEVRKSSWDELTEYIMGVEKRVAEIKHFGGLRNEGAQKLLQAVPPEFQTFVNHWFELSVGNNPWADRMIMDFVRGVNTIESAAKLALAVISNATQPVNNLMVAGTKAFGRTMLNLRDDAYRLGMYDFAERAGVTLENTLGEIAAAGEIASKGIARSVLNRTGFLAVEKWNRVLTANIGREWFKDLVKLGAKNKRAVRDLERIGFDQDDIVRFAKGAATEADEIKAARWLVEKTQFLARPGDFPLWWSNPWIRLAVLFKRFAYKQFELMIDSFKYNPVKTLVVAGAVMPAFGEVVADMRIGAKKLLTEPRDFIKDPVNVILRERPQIKWDDWDGDKISFGHSFLVRWFNALSWMGALGLGGDLLRATEGAPGRREAAIASFVLGPAASDIVKLGAGTVGTIEDVIEVAGRVARPERYEKEFQGAGLRSLGRAITGIIPYGQLIRGHPILQTPTSRVKELRTRIYDAMERGDTKAYNDAAEALQNEFGENVRSRDIRSVLRQRARRKR